MAQMKPDTREWTWVSEVPTEIQGERRELLHMLFAHTIRGGAEWAGPSPRLWRFRFPDSGGWHIVSELRQDQICPSRVAGVLTGEAFSDEKYQAEVMAVLRRIVRVPQAAS